MLNDQTKISASPVGLSLAAAWGWGLLVGLQVMALVVEEDLERTVGETRERLAEGSGEGEDLMLPSVNLYLILFFNRGIV